jgi:hypothetical protein
MAKSGVLVMRIDPAVKAAAKKAAAADRRSLAGLVEMLLVNFCREQKQRFERQRRQSATLRERRR